MLPFLDFGTPAVSLQLVAVTCWWWLHRRICHLLVVSASKNLSPTASQYQAYILVPVSNLFFFEQAYSL
jgi:hypothetical protein